MSGKLRLVGVKWQDIAVGTLTILLTRTPSANRTRTFRGPPTVHPWLRMGPSKWCEQLKANS